MLSNEGLQCLAELQRVLARSTLLPASVERTDRWRPQAAGQELGAGREIGLEAGVPAMPARVRRHVPLGSRFPIH